MLYTVGEIAKKLNIAPSTLRYYDKEGLLPFIERSGRGIRMFKEEDFEFLFIIGYLKKVGMSLKHIKTFIGWYFEGDSTITQRLNLIREQRKLVLSQIEQMHQTLHLLNYKQWYYEMAQKAGTCSIHRTMKQEEIPEEFRAISYTHQFPLR